MTPEELRALRIAEVDGAGDNHRKRWLVNKAQEMRLNPTEAEAAMQAILEETEYSWLPQAVIGKYIADFYCPALSLIVEVDGSVHMSLAERDAKRNDWFLQHGYNIYRVTNGAVLDRPEEVAQDIYNWLRELAWRKSA